MFIWNLNIQYKNDWYTIQNLTKPVFAFRHWENLVSSSRYPSWRRTVLPNNESKNIYEFYFQVLCELQMAMLERDIEFGEDISREIMKNDVRDIQDQSYRNLRDWYIYRDYMNGLEYIIHAFDYLQKSKSHH